MVEWRAIPGWEGYFEVSDDGRVRSIDRTVPHPTAGMRRLKGRELKPFYAGPMGYPMVTLTRAGQRANLYVHHAVLEAFAGPRPDGMEACHGPAGHLVNTPANLRWDTHKANVRDTLRDGNHHEVNKTRCKRGGHRLVAPNLSEAALRRGARKCLSCGAGYNAERRGEDRDQHADAFYAALGIEPLPVA